jgi:predicted membrane chloride channel (bestrophin family)
MFYIIRSIKYSWILLLVPALSALYAYLYENTEIFPKGSEEGDKWFDESITTIVAAATATLSFILGMTLNGAMTKNAEGIALFNAFTGDLLAFAMHLLSLSDDDKKDSEDYERARGNIRDLLLAAPGILKWSFRSKGVEVDLVQVKERSDGSSVKLSERNRPMYCAIKRYTSLGAVEAFMLVLGNEIEKLSKLGLSGETTVPTLIAKWENLYTSYGNLGNLLGWKPPALFSWWLGVCLYVYLILMPYTFVPAAGYHAIYLSFIISYFFLGAYVGLQKLGDPFAEGVSDSGEFATVTAAAKTAQQVLEELFRLEGDEGLDDIVCEAPDGAQAVMISREEIGLRERQSLLSETGMLY